jgi:hypothetical protein
MLPGKEVMFSLKPFVLPLDNVQAPVLLPFLLP